MNFLRMDEWSEYRVRAQLTLGGLLLLMLNVAHAQVISETKPWFKMEDLTYENPGCKNAWQTDKLDRWLRRNTNWIPQKNEMPYSTKKRQPGWLSDKEYEEIEVAALKDEVGHRGVAVFSSTDIDQAVRENQITWLDIDGDGKCDFIGWSFSYTGMSARGEQGETVYYIFLQKDNGFKLVDYTNIGTSRWSGTQQPDAILPVWVKGETRPFLVARSRLDFVSGESIGIFDSGRTALRWDASRNVWEEIGVTENREVARAITDFIQWNPPKGPATPCINTPIPCEAPR
jgi:hypothetical protein